MALNKTQIVLKARDIVGNHGDRNPTETCVPDEAIEAEWATIVRRINRIKGSTSARKERFFTAVGGTQRYSVSSYVGSDVYRIDEVVRSAAFVADGQFPVNASDCQRINQPYNGDAAIPAGLQGEIFDLIVQQARARRSDEFSWEVVGSDLVLYPKPETAEVVYVRYTATGYSVDTLPDDAESAMVYGAVIAILNGILNRTSSDKVTQRFDGQTTDERLKTLKEQRKYYEGKLESAMNELAQG